MCDIEKVVRIDMCDLEKVVRIEIEKVVRICVT